MKNDYPDPCNFALQEMTDASKKKLKKNPIYCDDNLPRVAPGEAQRLWDSSLLKPAAQQAVRLVLESKGGQEGSGGGKRAGIPVSRALDNLPLVVEGIQVLFLHTCSPELFLTCTPVYLYILN